MLMARILLAEDDPAVRATVRAVLKRLGHEVTEAADGAAAIKQIEAETFDLVITDVIMPEVEGLEVVRAVRSRRPDCPIIAMSGGGRIAKEEILTWAEKFGARYVLPKPFSADELRTVVAASLG
jgi:CheY-like chemotaxis protein